MDPIAYVHPYAFTVQTLMAVSQVVSEIKTLMDGYLHISIKCKREEETETQTHQQIYKYKDYIRFKYTRIIIMPVGVNFGSPVSEKEYVIPFGYILSCHIIHGIRFEGQFYFSALL